MRYIEKRDKEPECLSEYKAECREAGVPEPLLYKDFNRTSQLRDELCLDQHHVCCYCQRAVRGFRNEHLYPENGPDKEKSERLQLDYNNLFASCIDSQGLPENLQYCDVAKGNNIIREYIKESDCASNFRYLSTGEIVPNGEFYTLSEYLECPSLPDNQREALDTINTLNLNCTTLVNLRKVCIDSMLEAFRIRSKQEIADLQEEWLNSTHYPDFIELRIQYISRLLNS